MRKINTRVLVSGPDYFTNHDAINILMNPSEKVDPGKAKEEHSMIIEAFKQAGIEVLKIDPPQDCQDGVYTANWALIIEGKAILSRLPNTRKPEEQYARSILEQLGLKTITLPDDIKAFSGQGDSLLIDDYIFCQSPYRTDPKAHQFLKNYFKDKMIISLQTKPSRWLKWGPRRINPITGWLDSPTYDLDLALAILKPSSDNQKALIAYCPSLFKRRSRKLLKSLSDIDLIAVSRAEALKSYALNLVSTGETVILNSGTINLKADLIKHDLKIIELELPELKKGGGSIRCCSLSL